MTSPRYFCLSLPLLLTPAALPAHPNAPNRPPDQTILIWQEGGWQGRLPGGWTLEAPETSFIQEHMGGTTAVKNISVPLLEYYHPSAGKASDRAIIICPGGGYHILAWDLEGQEIATWLSSLGYHAFVLKYRLPRHKDEVRHAAALQDAQRAISLVRSRAAQWRIAPQRIGIMGFSAGGHLSAVASTASQRTYDAKDAIDANSFRPDFTILVYTAYGTAADDPTGVALAKEFHIDATTPPAFLAHAVDDSVPVSSATAWLHALRRHKVPVELHVYPDGGHGYGLRSDKSVKAWSAQLAGWLGRLN